MSPEEERLNGLLDAQARITEPPMSTEEKTFRMAIRGIVTILVVGMVIVGGCTAHSNSYDAERLSQEVKIITVKATATVAEHEASQAKIEAMERLVSDGANPIAIRCMLDGWSDNSTCLVVGLSLGKELTNK